MPKDIIKDFLLFNLIAEDSDNLIFELDQDDDLLSEDSDDDLNDDCPSDSDECANIEMEDDSEEQPFDEEELEFDESNCPDPEDLDDDYYDYNEYDDGGAADYGYRDDVDYEE